MQVLIRAINLDLGNSFCSTAEESSCPASDEDRGNNNDESDKNRLFVDTSAAVEDDQRNRLKEVFWGDTTRAATHERLEWWLAQIRNLNFPHLEEHLYRYVHICLGINTGSSELGLSRGKYQAFLGIFCRAGVEAGVYLSRLQRPISAQPGLRAR